MKKYIDRDNQFDNGRKKRRIKEINNRHSLSDIIDDDQNHDYEIDDFATILTSYEHHIDDE